MFFCFYRCQTPSHHNVFADTVIESFGAVAVSHGYLLCHLAQAAPLQADLSLLLLQ